MDDPLYHPPAADSEVVPKEISNESVYESESAISQSHKTTFPKTSGSEANMENNMESIKSVPAVPSVNKVNEFNSDVANESTMNHLKQVSKGSRIRHLPRTVQWKIQWNLLALPPMDDNTEVNAVQLQYHNSKLIKEQSTRVEYLLERHLWNNSPFQEEEGDQSRNADQDHDKDQDQPNSSVSIKHSPRDLMSSDDEEGDGLQVDFPQAKKPPVVDDPLSALAYTNTNDNSNTNTNMNNNTSINPENNLSSAEAKVSSKWQEFYTNREMIDLIYKDLKRLPPRLIFWDYDHDGTIDPHWNDHFKRRSSVQAKKTNTCSQVDPLYNMSTLRHAFSNDDADQYQNPQDKSQVEEKRQAERTKRIRILADLLFGYAKEHPDVGYRQGMHEILAHVFLALELDLAQVEATPPVSPSNTFDEDHMVDVHLTPIHPLSACYNCPLLLSRVNLRTDAYLLFEAWMEGLKPAYQDTNNRESSELQRRGGTMQMGQRILTLTSYASVEVYHLLQKMSEDMGAPPQLYCAKWMRLLFSREITSRVHVLLVWDALLDMLYDSWTLLWNTPALQQRVLSAMTATSQHTNKGSADHTLEQARDMVNSNLCLMDVIECAACSMILLQRRELLHKMKNSSEPDMAVHDCLSWMMNYPTMTQIDDFITMTTRVTRFHLEHKLGIIIPRKPPVALTPPTQHTSPSRGGTLQSTYKTATSTNTYDTSYRPQLQQSLQQQQINLIRSPAPPTIRPASFTTPSAVVTAGFSRILDGAKASAAQAIATMEQHFHALEAVPQIQNSLHATRVHLPSAPPVKTETTTSSAPGPNPATSSSIDLAEAAAQRLKRQRQLQQLAQHMEFNLGILRNYIVHKHPIDTLERDPLSQTPADSQPPEDVLKALEQLDRAQRVLALYGSKC